MPMQDWIQNYPGVHALLQQDVDELDYRPDGDEADGPWRWIDGVFHEGRLYFVASEVPPALPIAGGRAPWTPLEGCTVDDAKLVATIREVFYGIGPGGMVLDSLAHAVDESNEEIEALWAQWLTEHGSESVC
jgi:hypothetical protein